MTPEREAKLRWVIAARQLNLTVVLENVHDPHNISAVLRSCDAIGIYQVHLIHPEQPRVKLGRRSSASAKKWVAAHHYNNCHDCLGKLKEEGFAIAATHLGEQSVSLHEVDFTQKTALLFGNEHAGVSEEAMRYADINFLIPMVGMIPSLNISVACAVSLYEAFRQRIAHPGKVQRFTLQQQEEVLAEWALRDV